jgi:histidyl-tRNA synthetase
MSAFDPKQTWRPLPNDPHLWAEIEDGGANLRPTRRDRKRIAAIGEAFMKLRLVALITALVALPALVHAQGAPPSNAPKPTKPDAQKVVQIISNDKAKTQAYCDMSKLYEQMQSADQKDSKKVETLGKQADVLASKLGPEYNKLMNGLEQVDPNSNEGKELDSILSKLDNLCST